MGNVDRFLQDVIKGTYTGRLGTRQASALNGSIRLLMELHGWIQKTPLQIVQPQKAAKADIEKLRKVLRPDEQVLFARAIKRLESKRTEA